MPSSWREPSPPKQMLDVRCKSCRRLLFRISADRARVEVVCPDNRCKRYQQHRLQEPLSG